MNSRLECLNSQSNPPQNHLITTNVVVMALGAMILFVMTVIWNETAVMPKLPSTGIAVGYLILFGSIGVFVLTLYVLARWTASATSYSLVLIPMAPVLLGAWLAHETVTFGFLIGGVIVRAGAYSGAVALPELFSRLRGANLRKLYPCPSMYN